MMWEQFHPTELVINPFTTIGTDWFLLTAGTPDKYNTMTCSWGALGVLWNEPTVTAYVRTSRHTMQYLEGNPLFTIAVFDNEYREALQYCGTHSGRVVDKAKETGLTPFAVDGTTAFTEAKLILVCEKVYAQMMDESAILDKNVSTTYYSDDAMHKLYIGKIKAAYVKK